MTASGAVESVVARIDTTSASMPAPPMRTVVPATCTRPCIATSRPPSAAGLSAHGVRAVSVVLLRTARPPVNALSSDSSATEPPRVERTDSSAPSATSMRVVVSCAHRVARERDLTLGRRQLAEERGAGLERRRQRRRDELERAARDRDVAAEGEPAGGDLAALRSGDRCRGRGRAGRRRSCRSTAAPVRRRRCPAGCPTGCRR